MSEHSLWQRIRNNVGHTGHFARIEFNPEAGIPDVTFCRHKVEGFMELKFCAEAPARVNTRVFGEAGLRTSQVAWIYTRVKHGGRVWIVPEIAGVIYLVPGSYCRKFNEMTLRQIERAASWYDQPTDWDGWLAFANALTAGR